MKRLLIGVLLLPAAGCATPLTPARVEASFGRTFSGLYALQQSQEGRTSVTAAALDPRATCRRTGTEGKGPGDDWTCSVVYVDAQTTYTQVFEVQVKPDGCWRAEAPPVAQPAVRTDPLTGVTRANPLAGFDGCLDTSWK